MLTFSSQQSRNSAAETPMQGFKEKVVEFSETFFGEPSMVGSLKTETTYADSISASADNEV